VGRKKVAKAPTKKMSFEVSKGVLTNKLQNIKQLMELMRGDEIAKDNKYLMNPKAKGFTCTKSNGGCCAIHKSEHRDQQEIR
jgi:hypothetical protein